MVHLVVLVVIQLRVVRVANERQACLGIVEAALGAGEVRVVVAVRVVVVRPGGGLGLVHEVAEDVQVAVRARDERREHTRNLGGAHLGPSTMNS
jgi:hypothetical protein